MPVDVDKVCRSCRKLIISDLENMSELDSTYALLSSNLPVGGDPSSVKKTKKSKEEQPVVHVDSDEDEVFFGEKTYKELNGKNSK